MKRRLLAPVRQVAWCIIGIALTMLLVRPTNRVVAQWRQPGGVSYGTSDQYSLSVLEDGVDLFSLPLRHTHEIVVGRGGGSATDGHRVRYSFGCDYDNAEVQIRSCRIAWTPAGVTLTEASGNRVFVSKSTFAH